MKHRSLPASAFLILKAGAGQPVLLYADLPGVSTEAMEALVRVVVALARVLWALLSSLAWLLGGPKWLVAAPVELGRWVGRADTLDLALGAVGTMCVGAGMLLMGAYLP